LRGHASRLIGPALAETPTHARIAPQILVTGPVRSGKEDKQQWQFVTPASRRRIGSTEA
jgi:hypothetical protein